MVDLAQEYRDKVEGLPSDTLPMLLVALDLMRGDPDTLKAGYGAASATLAASEIFNVERSDPMLRVLRDALDGIRGY